MLNCYHFPINPEEASVKAAIFAAALVLAACTSAPRPEYRLAWPDGQPVKLNESRR